MGESIYKKEYESYVCMPKKKPMLQTVLYPCILQSYILLLFSPYGHTVETLSSKRSLSIPFPCKKFSLLANKVNL